MTKKERDEIFAIYQTLVLEESQAGYTELFASSNKETFDYARGYQDGVGKALDLIKNFMDRF